MKGYFIYDHSPLNERQAVAGVFRLAKDWVLTAQEADNMGFARHQAVVYICFAIDSMWQTGKCSQKNAFRAKNLIRHRLEGEAFLDHWVMKHIPGADDFRTQNRHNFSIMMQEYRHRWLDELIKEFSQ